jgi:hypothetical protein
MYSFLCLIFDRKFNYTLARIIPIDCGESNPGQHLFLRGEIPISFGKNTRREWGNGRNGDVVN